ncbi:MAG TPA: glycosyltransferase, partial [Christiangramia sp.]|nr:glycosyltransferase [Christiangramia sp.]
MTKKNLLFAINVDWYFDLHWKERILSEMTSDFDVTICYSRTKGAVSGHSPKTILLNIQRSNINPFSNFLSLLSARAILHHHSFDFIHAVTIKPNLYFGILARMYCKPIVITIPGLGSAFSSDGIKFILLRKLIRFLYRFIGKNKKAHYVFENQKDRDHFLEKRICTTDNCTVVSGAGVDLEKFIYTKEIYNVSNQIDVLFAGRLLKGKGLEDLINAITLINSSERRVNLYIAGITDTDSIDAIP